MKKSLVYLFTFILLINLISISLIIADDIPVNVNVPVIGTINSESGLPDSFEKFRAMSEDLSDEEKSKDYIYQEWTKLYAKNDKIAAAFFYTSNLFSTFDPLWENIFGINFSWSWEFIFCLILWIILAVMIYMPVKEIFNVNPILTIPISLVISSLVGKSGVIKTGADQLTFAVKNIWIALICLVIAVIFTIIYSIIMQKLGFDARAQSKKEELEKAEEKIKIHGKLSGEALK